MNKKPYWLALDFGGTKLASAVVNNEDGSILGYQRALTQVKNPSQKTIPSVESIVQLAKRSIEISGIAFSEIQGGGISFGGSVSNDGRRVIRSMHEPNWENFPLPDLLSEHFGLNFTMGNDGNVAALGEWVYGSHEKPNYFMYIQISTGIGGGFILNKNIYQGQGLGAEIGHQKVQFPDGKAIPCACGSAGCIEAIASGWAFAREAQRLFPNKKNNTAKTLIDSARTGNKAAAAIVQDAFLRFTLALSNTISLFDLDEIVIGGSVAIGGWDLLEPIILKNLMGFLPSELRNRAVVRCSKLMGTETLLGAAKLAEKQTSQ